MNSDERWIKLSKALAGGTGRLVSIVRQRTGKEYGRGDDRRRYGDDVVRETVQIGVSYGRLLTESREQIATLDNEAAALEIFQTLNARRLNVTPESVDAVTVADVMEAIKRIRSGLENHEERTERNTQAGQWEPMTLDDGTTIQGLRRRVDDPDRVHLWGASMGASTVLIPAPNGRKPPTKSKPATVAKAAVDRLLPLLRFYAANVSTVSRFTGDGITYEGGIVAL